MRIVMLLGLLALAVVCFWGGTQWQYRKDARSFLNLTGFEPDKSEVHITHSENGVIWIKTPLDPKPGDLLRFDGEEWRKVSSAYYVTQYDMERKQTATCWPDAGDWVDLMPPDHPAKGYDKAVSGTANSSTFAVEPATGIAGDGVRAKPDAPRKE